MSVETIEKPVTSRNMGFPDKKPYQLWLDTQMVGEFATIVECVKHVHLHIGRTNFPWGIWDKKAQSWVAPQHHNN